MKLLARNLSQIEQINVLAGMRLALRDCPHKEFGAWALEASYALEQDYGRETALEFVLSAWRDDDGNPYNPPDAYEFMRSKMLTFLESLIALDEIELRRRPQTRNG